MSFAIGAVTIDGRLDAFLEAVVGGAGERVWRPRFDALKDAATAAGLVGAVALLDDVFDAATEGDWRTLDGLARALRAALSGRPNTPPPVRSLRSWRERCTTTPANQLRPTPPTGSCA